MNPVPCNMTHSDPHSPTLVISRNRQAPAEETETASLLAAKFSIDVLSIPLIYDFPSDSPIIQRLRSLPMPVYYLVPLAERSVRNMLNDLLIPYVDVFESPEAVHIPDGGRLGGHVERIEDQPETRWYPVIDSSRCTGCLECVNYCLFGVYSIGSNSRPFVDQPDACRDGCPACARVCPGQAIMFPLYADRVIAGYADEPADNLVGLVGLIDQI